MVEDYKIRERLSRARQIATNQIDELFGFSGGSKKEMLAQYRAAVILTAAIYPSLTNEPVADYKAKDKLVRALSLAEEQIPEIFGSISGSSHEHLAAAQIAAAIYPTLEEP